MNAFGLDIGSDLIKVAKLERGKGHYDLKSIGMIKNPVSDLSFVKEEDLKTIAEAIKKIKNESRITDHNVIASIPERYVFSQVMEIADMKDDQLNQALLFEAENLIPRPLSEVNLDWQVIPNPASEKFGKKIIYLVAVPKEIVSKYLKVFELSGLAPIKLETETLSLIRCFNFGFTQASMVILNFGAKSLDIIVMQKGILQSARSFPTSGETITRLISSSLSLDFMAAEEYKKTYGLTNSVEGKIFTVIKPIVENISAELRKAIKYFEEKTSESLKLIVVGGGSSLMPGLCEYFAQTLNLEVQIADPLSFFNCGAINSELKKTTPFFTVSLGLALRGI